VFVHGCFWHRHKGCSRTTWPKTRAEYWRQKFEANIARDAAQAAELSALGWDVVIIWECETSNHDLLTEKLRAFLEAD
jgi:DNA mismatch endonuclease (patch repair protein)